MKQKEIIKLSKEDLQDKLVENQKQLQELRMTHSISPLENPLEIKRLRRIVARIKTAISN
jgi:large subunit ribosomal protein L29